MMFFCMACFFREIVDIIKVFVLNMIGMNRHSGITVHIFGRV